MSFKIWDQRVNDKAPSFNKRAQIDAKCTINLLATSIKLRTIEKAKIIISDFLTQAKEKILIYKTISKTIILCILYVINSEESMLQVVGVV